MISGTIYSATKMLQMTQKWEQKKASGNILKKEVEELSPEEQQVKMYQEQLKKEREGNEYSAIYAKIQSGQSLSPEEEEKIRTKDPKLYMEYKADKLEQEAYEKRLKNCKTKEEAEKLHVNRMNGKLSELKSIVNNPNIPKSEKLKEAQRILGDTTKTTQIFHAFTRSADYKKLPREEELLEAKRVEEKSHDSVPADENIATETMPEAGVETTAEEGKRADAKRADVAKDAESEFTKLERTILGEMLNLEKKHFGEEKKTVKIDVSL